MSKKIDDEVYYFYDMYPTEEDLMGESAVHASLVRYLVLVLQWLFHEQPCAIHENLNLYHTNDVNEHPIAPDVAVFKGVPYSSVISWRIGKTGPAPQVVFEIASGRTWDTDLNDKPDRYAFMGVREYFAYDPNIPPLWTTTTRRLKGWRYDSRKSSYHELQPDNQGHIWSEELSSWLVPDGEHLRLYDRYGYQRLTEAEALARKLRELGFNPDEL